MRVVHYINQFFGGIGGEEAAGSHLEERSGAVGPGRLLEQLLGEGSQIVTTLICGDNFAVEQQDDLTAAVLDKVRDANADLFVAGPCFEAGRYGMASGALCVAVHSELGIPAVTAMHEENPGVEKLSADERIGSPIEEGYITRGLIRDAFVDQTSAERLVGMVMDKVNGNPFESEMVSTSFEPIPVPAAVQDMSKAKVMIITDGGLVPTGNPDKIEGMAATRWGSYSIEGKDSLDGDDYEISHGGYDPRHVQEDPDRLVPLDALREMEKEGAIGELHNEFISTSGLANPLSNTRRMGKEMVEKVKAEGVDAVILTST